MHHTSCHTSVTIRSGPAQSPPSVVDQAGCQMYMYTADLPSAWTSATYNINQVSWSKATTLQQYYMRYIIQNYHPYQECHSWSSGQ